MSRITLHPEFGLNPSVTICFWCGEADGVALLGRNGGKEAPRQICTGYNPCPTCQNSMAQGITIMEASETPNPPQQAPLSNAYPTGRWVVISEEAAREHFHEEVVAQMLEHRKAFMTVDVFSNLFKTVIAEG